MEMKYKVFLLLISTILLSASTLATSTNSNSDAQPYYIDPQHNLWLKVNMNGSTQHFNVYNTPGYSPKSHGVKREINEVWGYKTSHTPKKSVVDKSA
jgi:hypothetical protein